MQLALPIVVLLSVVALGALAPRPAGAAEPATYSGKAYPIGGSRDKVLFTFKRSAEVHGETKVSTTTYEGADGKVLATDIAEFKTDTDSLKTYKLSQKQEGTEEAVEVRDGKAFFTFKNKDGKVKTGSEDIGDNFIVGPSIGSFIRKHWAEIMKGDHVKARIGVPSRLETVGFEYSKEKEETVGGEAAIVIKMKPSSFIIAALVDPLHFYFARGDQKLLQIEGRTQMKQEEGSKLKDLDALTVYEYGPK